MQPASQCSLAVYARTSRRLALSAWGKQPAYGPWQMKLLREEGRRKTSEAHYRVELLRRYVSFVLSGVCAYVVQFCSLELSTYGYCSKSSAL